MRSAERPPPSTHSPRRNDRPFMTPSYSHRRTDVSGRGLPSQIALPQQSLLAAILADCARVRREQGRPPLTATLDVARHHEQSLLADPVLLRRALEPLIRRAFESASESVAGCESPVVREVIVTSVDVGSAIEIEVADSGPSLSEGVRIWLNQATQASAEAGFAPEGAGLALAAVRAAVARINGTLHAANCPEGGVAITLRLPRLQSQRLAA